MPPLRILSYNIRGLASRSRRVRTRILLENLHHQPDILCLQEHKLRQGRTDRIQREVWRSASWICAPAAEGVHASRNQQVIAGKGGVALGIRSDLAPFIARQGITNCGRAVWVCIDHPEWGRMGFTGIYGPNDTDGRISLWAELTATLDVSFKWFLCGDFNMITNRCDQLGGEGSIVKGREARIWASLMRHLNVQDTFSPVRGSLSFSWDNKRIHRHNPANVNFHLYGARTLRRLDRIYSPPSFDSLSAVISTKIIPGMALSDHAPVLALIQKDDATPRPTRYRLNTAHLQNADFLSRIDNLWKDRERLAAQHGWDPDVLLAKCISGTGIVDRCWGKRRAKERKARLLGLRHCLAQAQQRLEANPGDEITQGEVQAAEECLTQFEKAKADWVDQTLQARWIMDGDKGTKLFFKNFRSLATSKQIPSLLDDQGTAASSWEEMAEVVKHYFEKSFSECTPPPSTTESIEHWQEILEPIPDLLTPEEKRELNADLSVEELGEAARNMQKLKCPGPDGLPVEFFNSAWPTVGPILLRVLNCGMTRGAFPENLTKGLIVLLPKKLDQRLLTNKRPITLLNVAYKIGAKALQRRLTPILQRIIAPQQFAFLPGRNIHHSLLLLGEMLHQATESGGEYMLIKFDVIKDFDRLEWPFLFAVLRKMGLDGMLTNFLKASCESASSAVLLNGIPTPSFVLRRSVRQGCPLSPLLFIIAFDALNVQLQQAQSTGKLAGVFFPEANLMTLQNMFADNLSMVIQAVLAYIIELRRILDIFGEVSGLHCNWTNTVAAYIPAGPPSPIFDFLNWK